MSVRKSDKSWTVAVRRKGTDPVREAEIEFNSKASQAHKKRAGGLIGGSGFLRNVLTADSVERMLRAVIGWGGRKMNVPTYRLLATV